MTKEMKKFFKWLGLFLGAIFWLPIFYRLYQDFNLFISKGNSLDISQSYFLSSFFVTTIFLFLLILLSRGTVLLRWFFCPIVIGGYGWILSGLFRFNLIPLSNNSCIPVLVKEYKNMSETNSVLVTKLARISTELSYRSASAILGIFFGVVIITLIFSIIGICKKRKKRKF